MSVESMRRLLLVLLLGILLAAPVLGLKTAVNEKNGKDVDSLIKDLKDDNSTIREIAADALVEINDTRAVEALIQALNDNDSIVRWRSAEALVRINDTRGLYPLIQALKDGNWSVRGVAAGGLGELRDKRSVEPLIQALKDEDNHVRTEAAWALGEINDTRAAEPLIQALKDDNWRVRGMAAWTLGEINDIRAVEPLIQSLKDDDWTVRANAAISLGRINDTRAVEPLIQALKDENENVRSEAKKALTKLGWKQTGTQVQPSGMANDSMQGGCHTDPVTGRIICMDLSHSTSTQGTQNGAQQGNAFQLSGNWKMTGHQTGFNDWGANLTLNFDGTMAWTETKGSNVGANRTGTWQFDGTTFTMTWVSPGGGKTNWISKSVHESYLEDGTYTVENAPGGLWSAFRADNRSLKTAIPAKGEIEDSSKPKIGNLQPPDRSSTTDNMPMISADLADEGSGVNVSSVRISVDGTGVTEKATVISTRVWYTPKEALASGSHHAQVTVEDNAGNLEEKSWYFMIYSDIDRSAINTSQANLSKGVRSYPKSSESFTAHESNPSQVLNTTPQRNGPTIIIPDQSVPQVNNTSPTILNISSPATVNIYINTTQQPNGPTVHVNNPSVPKVNNTPPPTEPYTRLINGYVKYVGGNVVRIGVNVKLQEIFNGNIFDIGSAVSSRQDGSFKIMYSSDRLRNPDKTHLILQAFSGGKPFSDPMEIMGDTNDKVELICSPHQSG